MVVGWIVVSVAEKQSPDDALPVPGPGEGEDLTQTSHVVFEWCFVWGVKMREVLRGVSEGHTEQWRSLFCIVSLHSVIFQSDSKCYVL